MAVASESYAPSVLVSTEGLPEKDWLEYRRRGIGGSDAAAILGISPFATARDLYYDKLKIVPFDDSESNWVAKKMGHLLEDLVAEIFHVKTGYRIYQIKKMFYHPVHTFMLADIDYFVELPGGRTAILEIKTTNYNAKDHWWSEDGQEIVPLNYEAQGRHYMTVMNIDEVFYCCLYGNNEDEVIIRHIDRDRDYEAELIALEQDFWENHILTGMPPPYTEDGDLILNSVRRHFGPADPSAPELILEGNMALLIPRYLELQTQRNAEKRNYEHIEAEMRRLQGRIVAEMGRSCTAVCQGREAAYSISYSVSMVFYAVDADVSGEYRKAIRRYRQMFFYENGTLFQSRLYPADTGNALEVSKLFRHLVQQAISRCLTEPNLWYLKTKRPDLNAHLSTYRGSLHYPDYNYHGNLSVLQGHRKDTELTIGAAARCVCCGNELRSNGAIKCSCKEVAVCRKCGQTVARGQGIYLEDGFYCKTCLHICAACGRPTLGTMYPAYNRRGALVEVCQDCYQQLTSGCASCSMASACRAMGHTLCEKATVAVA